MKGRLSIPGQSINNGNSFLSNRNTEGAWSHVYAFGRNKNGELSLGNYSDISSPTSAKGIGNKKARYISSGSQHSAIVMEDGSLYICGSCLHGKLGLENLSTTNINKFQKVSALKDIKVKSVACGDYHTLCLTDNGIVYSWGGNLHKKLGKYNLSPASIEISQNPKIIQIGCGDYHSVALSETGKMYSWGGGGPAYNKGQLGLGHLKDVLNPELVNELSEKYIVSFACGGFHTLALTSDNKLFAWGSSELGECGTGEKNCYNKPRQIFLNYQKNQKTSKIDIIEELKNSYQEDDKSNEDIQIKQIAAGGHHSIVLTEKGQIYTFGYGSQGQLGIPKRNENQFIPHLVVEILHMEIVYVCAGWVHSLILNSKGEIYACGEGKYGQLGLDQLDSFECQTEFTKIKGIENKNVWKIFAGGRHSWIILDHENPFKIVPNASVFGPANQKNEIANKEKINLEKIGQMNEVKYYLQIKYCDVKKIHRFIHFSLPDRNREIAMENFQKYLERINKGEFKIIISKITEDQNIIESSSNLIVSNSQAKVGKNYTAMMIVNIPGKYIEPEKEDLFRNNDNDSESGDDNNIEVVSSILIEEFKTVEGLFGMWAHEFEQCLREMTSDRVYLELRPRSLRNFIFTTQNKS